MLININRYQLIVIVELSITENFILIFLANKKRFSIYKKEDTYDLIIIDKNPLLSIKEKVNKKTKPSLIATQQYYKKIIFDIIPISTQNNSTID